MENPRGPIHFAIWLASTKASKTVARGASNSLVIVRTRSPGSAARSTCICSAAFALAGDGTQVFIEAVEALLPIVPVVIEPVGRLLEWARLQPARPPLRLAAADNQSGAFQHLEMFGNPRSGHLERLGEFIHRSFPERKPRQDRTPCRIGEGGEDVAQGIGRHRQQTIRLSNH